MDERKELEFKTLDEAKDYIRSKGSLVDSHYNTVLEPALFWWLLDNGITYAYYQDWMKEGMPWFVFETKWPLEEKKEETKPEINIPLSALGDQALSDGSDWGKEV